MVVDCSLYVILDEGEDSGVKIDLERFHLEQQVLLYSLVYNSIRYGPSHAKEYPQRL